MPTYQFRCTACGLEFELHRPFSESRSATCVKCQSAAARVFYPPTVLFNGPGFTRRPAIMDDPIARGHPGRLANWGTENAKDFGNPDVPGPPEHRVEVEAGGDDVA
jgi:putative FmdB family regulatory protein